MPMQISFIVNLTLESSRYANQTIESLLGYELEKKFYRICPFVSFDYRYLFMKNFSFSSFYHLDEEFIVYALLH